jgi:hypothetical protein
MSALDSLEPLEMDDRPPGGDRGPTQERRLAGLPRQNARFPVPKPRAYAVRDLLGDVASRTTACA